MNSTFSTYRFQTANMEQSGLRSKVLIIAVTIMMLSLCSIRGNAVSHDDYCATCLTKVERSNAIIVKYHGQKFYFDDQKCADKFNAAPGNYVSSLPRYF